MKNMHTLRFGLLTAVCVLGSASAASADHHCGGKGEPSCPFQGWMEDEVQVPMEEGKLDKVAAALAKVAKMAPDPSWNKGEQGWEAIARSGASAAKAGDTRALKRSCKSCHKAFRKKYKAQHRMRPVPK